MAIEIRQYAGDGLKTLVPRVFGLTATAHERKTGGASARGPEWTEEAIFAKLAERGDRQEMAVVRRLFDWSKKRFASVGFGNGRKNGSFIPFVRMGKEWFGPFRVYTGDRLHAYIEIPLAGSGMSVAPFSDPAKRIEYARRINQVPGVSIAEDPTRYPNIPVSALASDAAFNAFADAVEWALKQVEGRTGSPTEVAKGG